jgi:hypothetical protein
LWRLVAVGETEKPKIDFQFFARHILSKIPVAPLSASVRVGTLLSGSFKRDAARRHRQAFSLVRAITNGQKAPRASDFEWRTRLRVFPGAIDTLRRVP